MSDISMSLIKSQGPDALTCDLAGDLHVCRTEPGKPWRQFWTLQSAREFAERRPELAGMGVGAVLLEGTVSGA